MVVQQPVILQRRRSVPALPGSRGVDVIDFRGHTMWYAAIPHEGRDRIVAGPMCEEEPEFLPEFDLKTAHAAVIPGWHGSFDCHGASDPASVTVGSTIVLFYTATDGRSEGIGRATSTDGTRYVKYPWPLLAGRDPEVVYKRGRFCLFYVAGHAGTRSAIFLAKSKDGVHFHHGSKPVLASGPPGAWDSNGVTTPRVFLHGAVYYMFYAGSDLAPDEPSGLGLARSSDLEHWQRYVVNPVLRTGHPGAWDDGTVRFGTAFARDDLLCIAYSGSRRPSAPGKISAHGIGIATIPMAAFEQATGDENEWAA